MALTSQPLRSILFISPHFPFPPTEGGMIRTYSLIRALHPDWKIHFLVLHNSGQPVSKACLNDLYLVFPNLRVEEYGTSAVNSNLVEKFRAEGRFQRAVALRDKLKHLAAVQAVLSIVNLPFNLYFLLKKYRNAFQLVRDQLKSAPFDAVLVDYTKMAYLAPAIRKYPVKKILNIHNAESDLARQMISTYENGAERRSAWLDWQVYKFYEKYYVPKFDLLLAPTEADVKFHRRPGREVRMVVFPNGVDTSTLRFLPPSEQPISLIFPGRMDYPPNAHAMSFFCKEVLPRIAVAFPSVRFYIVGKNPPHSVKGLQSEQVVITGYVDDIQPFWRKAAVLVVPLAIGGGTRIKILEAMALGRPVVSTTKGCEGLEVAHEKHLLIADGPERFAEQVIRVLKNPEESFEMSLSARKLVEEKYSFAALATLLLRTLEDIASEPGPSFHP